MLSRIACWLRQFARSYRRLAVVAVAIATVALVLLLDRTPVRAEFNEEDCTFDGIKLYGKVEVVDNWADIKIQVVDSWPDLKVQEVTSFADSCGKWEFVTSFPDFTITYVDNWPDLKVQFVDNWPGVP